MWERVINHKAYVWKVLVEVASVMKYYTLYNIKHFISAIIKTGRCEGDIREKN